jgi:hypothetical protein
METSKNFPTIKGDLITALGISVQVTEHYEPLKAALDAMSEDAGVLSVKSDRDAERMAEYLKDIRRLKESLNASFSQAESEIAHARQRLDSLRFALHGPINNTLAAAQMEANSYAQWKQAAAREEEARVANLEREAKEKIERQNELFALKGEISIARQVADNAERFGRPQTAKEIREALAHLSRLETSPESFKNPAQDAKEVRSALAGALQREQDRGKGG